MVSPRLFARPTRPPRPAGSRFPPRPGGLPRRRWPGQPRRGSRRDRRCTVTAARHLCPARRARRPAPAPARHAGDGRFRRRFRSRRSRLLRGRGRRSPGRRGQRRTWATGPFRRTNRRPPRGRPDRQRAYPAYWVGRSWIIEGCESLGSRPRRQAVDIAIPSRRPGSSPSPRPLRGWSRPSPNRDLRRSRSRRCRRR
jgi:hypothetical protein